MSSALKNIALVGASGNLGSLILSSLVSKNRFNITALTRLESENSIPAHPSVKVLKGSYDDATFLRSAFANQDALLIIVGWSTSKETQNALIDAAAAAGIKWILPCEFGSDNGNVPQSRDVPVSIAKTPFRERIEAVGSKWIGVVTNPWLDYGLKRGMFSIDVPKRKATIMGSGDVKFITTNLSQAAAGTANLLCLPIFSSDGKSLNSYANGFVYLASHLCSQRELLQAVQRVTGTTDADWDFEKVNDVPAFRKDCRQKFYKGEVMGGVGLLMGQLYVEGSGSNYEQKLDNEALGLKMEDLDESVRKAL